MEIFEVKKLQTIYKLTKRELEVLYFAIKGLSNKEIAEKLYITFHTSKRHISSILNKLQAKSRIAAAVIVIKEFNINV